jgi:hypothetical protein
MSVPVYEERDGKPIWSGERPSNWVPRIVDEVVAAARPVRVVLLGPLARDEEPLDVEIELLVVVERKLARGEWRRVAVEIRNEVSARVPVLIEVLDLDGWQQGIERSASSRHPSLDKGRLVYERGIDRTH